ncbi:hypothetical protein AFCDBAGC_2830 [Methylobacterium cerastii]|uniref:Uncharacterized protein n=1 Tax=Methylobacterium cerastii TaxID=932741 RepID=A0ABQ4QJP5_9HYPH|nr:MULTISPECIES: hypothetical protein [Methylobacterium]TXM65048.1 hypothetical protein FV229_16770 [Methylobacterium sp. WL120]TXM74587.1 hypothetical protein FV226_05715 [Methylobacterium sp. WL12]TXM95701.1 hypothetical protein FV222_20220 [Methylobacterium sp. WL103]TXN80177.1 hypothetical protein FV234_17895 [Methylobacterium sp. WL8]GJD44961.1 hypothetical protein AFCDBAGC_2830 [Methylobacterium cerastii]
MISHPFPKPLLAAGLAIALATGLLAAASPVKAGEAGTRYASWHGCLDRHFGLQATIGSRPLAADAAIGACREPERAYLSALAASPLLDADDAQQARAALVAQARARLLGRRAAL